MGEEKGENVMDEDCRQSAIIRVICKEAQKLTPRGACHGCLEDLQGQGADEALEQDRIDWFNGRF